MATVRLRIETPRSTANPVRCNLHAPGFDPMSDNQRPVFTLADMAALRWLAVALGVVLCGICVVSKAEEEVFLAVGLVVVMMIVCLAALYFLRRRQARGKEKP